MNVTPLRQPIHQQLSGIADLAQRLATGTSGWRTFAPRIATLDQATTEADALARALRELRRAMLAEVPSDAA